MQSSAGSGSGSRVRLPAVESLVRRGHLANPQSVDTRFPIAHTPTGLVESHSLICSPAIGRAVFPFRGVDRAVGAVGDAAVHEETRFEDI